MAKEETIKTEISVIMLAFNRETLIARAIESILNQTFTNFEYIIVDNGSTDRSGAIAAEYAKKDSRIRVIRRERGNIGSGRNAGLDAAKGDYIAFVDDDDWAYPDMLSLLYKLITDHQADISFCGSDKEVDGKIVPQFVFDEVLVMEPEKAVYELLERRLLNLATPTKLFRKGLFGSFRFSETGKYDDISTTYKLFASSVKIAAHGIPLYCFARHIGNNSKFTDNDTMLSPEQLEEYFTTYRERTVYLLEKLPKIADYITYSEWSFLLSMYRKIIINNFINFAAQREYAEKYLEEAEDRYVHSPYIKPFELDYLCLFKNNITRS